MALNKESVRAILVARSIIRGLRIARLAERATAEASRGICGNTPMANAHAPAIDGINISKASTVAALLTNLRKLRSF